MQTADGEEGRTKNWRQEEVYLKMGGGFSVIKMYICRNTPDVPQRALPNVRDY
jgi:hypothetical protein